MVNQFQKAVELEIGVRPESSAHGYHHSLLKIGSGCIVVLYEEGLSTTTDSSNISELPETRQRCRHTRTAITGAFLDWAQQDPSARKVLQFAQVQSWNGSCAGYSTLLASVRPHIE